MANTLSEKSYNLFLDIYIPLLFYANSKTNTIKNIETINDFKKLKFNDKYKIRNNLYANPKIFEDFVQENPFNFNSNEIQIIKSWGKYHIKGSFFLLQYSKNYNLFYEEKTKLLYGILDLSEPLENHFGNTLPVFIHTVLLPFENSIIHDGMTSYDNIYFGSGIKRNLKHLSEISKLENGIITSLPYKKSINKSDKDKLEFYLRDKKSRLYHKDSIETIINNNRELKSFYFQFMGKLYSKDIQSKLKLYNIEEGYFAILFDTIICSAKSKDDLNKIIDTLIPNSNKDLIYVFHYKGNRKSSLNTG